MQFSTKLQEMFELSPGMVAITVGPEHRLQYANATLREALGDHHYLGTPAPEVAHVRAEQNEIRAYLDSVYRSGAPLVRRAVNLTLANASAERGPSYYDAMYHPLFDDDGRVVGVFAEGHDVTARVALEAAEPALEAKASSLPQLTDRQREVLAGIMAGLGNKQIAHRLGISARTAEMHRTALLARLGLRTTGQLVSALATRPDIVALANIREVIPDGHRAKGLASRELARQVAHSQADLEEEMSAFGALMQSGRPARTEFIEARYAITQASLRRRDVLRRATDFLMSISRDEERAVVRRVTLSDDALLKLSAAHTSKWKTEAAFKNWDDYRRASKEMRDRMAAQIGLERSLLLPLLEANAAK